MHHGIDIPVSTGHNIYAIADGVITDSAIRSDSCGGTLKVDHGDVDGKKLSTRFCHCSKLLKNKGDQVKKGDVIAISGGGKGDVGRGGSTGSHIHFEVYENGKTVDPMPYYTGGKQITSQETPTGISTDTKTDTDKKTDDNGSKVNKDVIGSLLSSKDSDMASIMKLFSGDYDKMSTQEKNKALLPLFSMMGLDVFRDLLDNPNVTGSSPSSDEVTQAIDKIKTQMPSDNKTVSTGSKISSLPSKIQNAITRLKNEYGITITDDHIKKEFEQEGNYREDAGGENSEARKNIEKLIQDAKSKFGGKIPKGIVSGYRSYDDQVRNFGGKAKSRGVENTQKANTVPGFSQHHTGKAFDIFSVDTSWWNRNSDVKEWVAKNAKNYGFDVTYKTQGPLRIAEPWHLYYVGGSVNEEILNKVGTIYENINRIKKLMI